MFASSIKYEIMKCQSVDSNSSKISNSRFVTALKHWDPSAANGE